MIKSLKSFVANESGATAIEYALIASLIAVFLIGALSALGTKLSSEFAEVGSRAQVSRAKAQRFRRRRGPPRRRFLLPSSVDGTVARRTRIGDWIKGSRSGPSLELARFSA